MRILGIDPGVAIVGFGLIESERSSVRMLQYGAVTTPAGLPLAGHRCGSAEHGGIRAAFGGGVPAGGAETLFTVRRGLFLRLQQRQILPRLPGGGTAAAEGRLRPEAEGGSRKVGGKKARQIKASGPRNPMPPYVDTPRPEKRLQLFYKEVL